MMRYPVWLAAAVSLSLIGSAAVGSTRAPAPATGSDGWLTLSMLTPSGSAALAGTAAGAAQPDAVTPPAAYARPGTPPIPVLLVWLGVLGTMVYIATKSSHHRAPNSPA